MFTSELKFSDFYYHLEVPGKLPSEGKIWQHSPDEKDRELTYRRIEDGIAVYDSTLLTSGFLYPGTPYDFFVPQTINGVPVTELHQTFYPEYFNGTIENIGLKRVFIEVNSRIDLTQMRFDRSNGSDFGLAVLAAYSRELSDKNEILDCDVRVLPGNEEPLDFCLIKSDYNLNVSVPNAKKVKIKANRIVLRGEVPDGVEEVIFIGAVTPSVECDWDAEIYSNTCFENHKKLRVVDGSLGGENGWSFRGCEALERVHLSEGILRLPPYAFEGCRSLTDLYVPDSVTEIGEYAFSGCTSLRTVHLPSKIKKIKEGTFQNCSSLKKVFLSDEIEAIEDHAFAGCTSLRKPWIPKNIRFLSDTAFS